MRWAIAEFKTESNTFSPVPIELNDFRNQLLLQGEEILSYYPDKNLEMSGFLEVANAEGAELIPIVAASANPGGKVTNEAYEYITEILLRGIRNAGRLDGVLLALHGSMVTYDHDDAEGAVLKQVRNLVGPQTFIVVTLDLHCNITRKMVQMASVLVPFRTCPHVDQADTGRRAAGIMARMINNGARPTAALRKPNMILQVSYASTGPGRKDEPFSQLVDMAAAMEKEPHIISAVVTGQQRTIDIEEMGPAVVVVTDDNPELAEQLADKLADKMWEMRYQLAEMPFELRPPKEAIERAMCIDGGPVLFVEYADSPTGGSPGDCVELLKALIDARVDPTALAAVTDPQAVGKLVEAGVGKEVTIELGGRLCTATSQPLLITGKVRAITDGRFVQKGLSQTGVERNMGRAVVMQSEGIRVIINEKRTSCVDPEIFRSMGIEPREMKIVAAKCVWHLLANYGPFAKGIIYIDTPGMMSFNLSTFEYRKIRRPMFPLDPI